MAIIISSFGKMLLILMVIWDYSTKSMFDYSWLISVLVLASNFEALSVLLDIGAFPTMLLMAGGILIRTLVQFAYLYGTTMLSVGWTDDLQVLSSLDLMLPLMLSS